MADWKKLNAEFDSIMDNLTDEDFRKWAKSKPKRNYSPCPICNGSGKRIDKKTNLPRHCVGCKGTGII
jgi:DnaJ-class molecular chaperone